MGLLSNQQKTDIRAAIKSVTDTFFVTPVAYQIVGESLDRFQEDRRDRVKATYNLLGMVEYPDGASSHIKAETGGAIDTANVKVTFNLEDLQQQPDLVNGDFQVAFNPTKDYMIINGLQYETSFMLYDGALDQKNVLVIVYGDLNQKPS